MKIRNPYSLNITNSQPNACHIAPYFNIVHTFKNKTRPNVYITKVIYYQHSRLELNIVSVSYFPNMTLSIINKNRELHNGSLVSNFMCFANYVNFYVSGRFAKLKIWFIE